MLECVVNISEGQRTGVISAIAHAAGPDLLDIHTDRDHHRSVLTLVGEDAPRRVADEAVHLLDLNQHQGVHPRLGVLDVVPFVPLGDATMDDALAARDRFARWLADTHQVPSFLYGTERTLPEIRRGAFTTIFPDVGPAEPHPTAGAASVGARPLLVAYNLWLTSGDVALARAIAREIRGPAVRALGLLVDRTAQVSMNLIAPDEVGPAAVYDAVAARAPIGRAELVGLIPRTVLDATEVVRWPQLDLANDRTIEFRLERAEQRAREAEPG